MDKILSIIIPSYNMEAYLAKGLDSVLSIDNPSPLDVIVVNDGSKDGTLEIARSYATRFPGIVNVIDKENGHYGSCINAGLKIAQGKFRKADEATKAKELEAYKEKFATPYQAAELGYIDEIIYPRQTRKRLIQALEMTENKMQTNPPKKHGNMPL